MKATQKEQHALIELSKFDLEIRRLTVALRALTQGEALESARSEQRAVAEAFLAKQTEFENLGLEVDRLNADLDLVATRLKRDQERLGTLGNPREYAAVEGEIVSLKARQSALETLELETLELRDSLQSELAELTHRRNDIATKLSALESDSATEIGKLQSQISSVEQQANLLKLDLSAELLLAYERKSERGIAASQIADGACGACRLMLTPTASSALKALPADEVTSCPNCEAFLVR